jgi:hypothetical protein
VRRSVDECPSMYSGSSLCQPTNQAQTNPPCVLAPPTQTGHSQTDPTRALLPGLETTPLTSRRTRFIRRPVVDWCAPHPSVCAVRRVCAHGRFAGEPPERTKMAHACESLALRTSVTRASLTPARRCALKGRQPSTLRRRVRGVPRLLTCLCA